MDFNEWEYKQEQLFAIHRLKADRKRQLQEMEKEKEEKERKFLIMNAM